MYMPTNFDCFAKNIGCTCVHPCPLLGPPMCSSKSGDLELCLVGRAGPHVLDANLLHAHFQDCLDAYLSVVFFLTDGKVKLK